MNYAEVILVYDGKGIILKEYIKNNWEKSFNEPVGNLKYKFIDPAANYRGQLFAALLWKVCLIKLPITSKAVS